MDRRESPSTTPPDSPHERLELMFHLTAPAIRAAMAALELPNGSHVLDAGCGAGSHTELLHRQVGPTGRVTGLDISPDNLERAREHCGQTPDFEWVLGDIRQLPFPDETFNCVWCSDVLWPGAVIDHPTAVVDEFARVTKPGGVVSLVYWSSQTLLPGYPVLEATLNQAFVGTAPYLAGVAPELHFLRAASWLSRAGLANTQANTFVAEVRPPLAPITRQAMASCFSMFWGHLADQVSPSDWELYRRLCQADSPDFVADLPDYHAFITYTMFSGRLPRQWETEQQPKGASA